MIIKRIKIWLFILFCLCITLPLIFTFTRVNKNTALKGAVILTEKAELKLNTWWQGKFQEKFEKYINDNIGFRPYLVRSRNQVAYSLFDKVKAAGVIRGKENYLYELNYLKAYNGIDFIGGDSITNNLKRIKRLQDSLETIGKTFLVCLAPGKGSFYPEYFPEKYNLPKTNQTNYKLYSKGLKDFGINHIDYNKWFMQMKDTSRFILYPKYGIHWSYYGMLLASDSLISKIEELKDIDLPNLKIGKYRMSKKLKRMDYDIADGLNLLFQLSSAPMCYPEAKWETRNGKAKPKALVISDSFYWSMYDLGIGSKSLSRGGFWFYNRQVYPESFSSPLKVQDVNIDKAIIDNDVFVMIVTESNLPKFPWGFVKNALKEENLNNTIEENKDKLFQAELKANIKNIKASENWMKSVRKNAKLKNISIDSMLVLDATWMIYHKKSKGK